MKNLLVLLKLYLCLLFVYTGVMAQTADDLVGTWEADGATVTTTIHADGTYTFEIPASNYFEQGTWQFDGVNYSQQWQDPFTGEAMNETYTVEFSSADSFTQSGGNLNGQVFFFTRTNTETLPDQPATDSPTMPEQSATNPLNTSNSQNTLGPTPDQLAAQGIDPETMLIPDEFHCYLDEYGDDYSQFDFALTILPNQQYSTDFGTGNYEIVDRSPIEVNWLSGPFVGDNSYAYANYNDYGQNISLYGIGREEQDYNCYQRGPREEQIKLELAFKDPQPGTTYTCVEEDTGNQGPTLELLENRVYRVDGIEGEYTVDLMNDPEDDLPSVDYVGGAWEGGYGFISANEETGMREISVSTDNVDYECSFLGAPLQGVQFGSAPAPAPPAGAGGLEGFYASWSMDLMGICGGVCWDYLYFFPNGYVYTERPEGLLEQIDCTRTRPNGAPLCDVYTIEGSTIYFSDGERKSFAQTAEGLEIDGDKYSRIPGFDGLVLNGTYKALSYTAAVGGQGGVAIEKTFTFKLDGTFTREGFAGASYTSTDTGTQFGDPVAGVTVTSESSNSGTYQIQGNAITFNYADGQVSTDFFFVMPGEDPANPGAIRIGGWDFLLRE